MRSSGLGSILPRFEHGRRFEAVTDVALVAGRSPWVMLVLLLSAVGYLLGQRALDRTSQKLAHPAAGDGPDDHLIQL